MESLFIVWRLLLLLSLFVFTQLLGVLLYFRLARLPKWLASGICILGAAFAFFFLSPMFFFAPVNEAVHVSRASCGMPALAAAFMVLFGTGLQLFIGAAIHLWLFRRGRSR